jgi:hypothetical protein
MILFYKPMTQLIPSIALGLFKKGITAIISICRSTFLFQQQILLIDRP